MNLFDIEYYDEDNEIDDGIGGYTYDWTLYETVGGYLDMLTGSDKSSNQNAFIEESTHVLIIPKYLRGVTDDMRLVDDYDDVYDITYVDDPVNMHHHIELYLVKGGVRDGNGR